MSISGPFIISVAGAHSGVGKTTLCTIILREMIEFGAVKFTKTPLYTSLVDDINILSEKGKDTALFLESGASKVLWVQSPYHKLKNILDVAISRMKGLKGIVVEGNSPVDFINPHLIIFITGSNGEIKASAVPVSKKADIIVINSEEKKEPSSFLTGTWKEDAEFFRIDLSHKKGEIYEFLYYLKKRVAKDTH
jgi:molybdopterin-guanine dinucleotide biosynthesis protein